ncbi:hypothetical protein PAXRUDRAFT_30473 [Paxillus rubicundulus Ve08.2h10]|uniref:Heterokaryon incompatibility domain-containing protein n=1 Tax=Paxillus rubicundulus Ve08.2h10 TaxID=930991 RepID=A0A0D0DLM8_9AGAM|nr:hypothetical protein PAXRUDRAFT_30473 [Paxillus rubicundulus Ve08.2h10]
MLPQERSQTSRWGEACLAWVRERLGTNSLPSRIPPIPPLEPFALHSPQLQDAEVNRLSIRQQLLDYVDEYIFNNIPTHLLRMSDMKLATRNEIWEAVRPKIEADVDAALTELSSSDFVLCFMDQWCLKYIKKHLRYAIFSHRWGIGEPSFYEMSNKRCGGQVMPTGPGFEKLLQFCEKARTDYGCAYVWSDTCCINKESSTDLEEAIRSMYRWYADADICIVYLARSSSVDDFTMEPWFARGWTLQELLAPKKMRFYGKEWTPIFPSANAGREGALEEYDLSGEHPDLSNDKENELLLGALAEVTGIPVFDLRDFRPGCNRVFQKMIWTSKRRTTRIEDVAYSLLGIFDVTMPIAYGEGNRAFYRLMEVIAQRCDEPGFFAWAGPHSRYSNVFPLSPASYGRLDSQMVSTLARADLFACGDLAFVITKSGLSVTLLLLLLDEYPSVSENGDVFACTFTPTNGKPLRQRQIALHSSQGPYNMLSYEEHYALGIVNYGRAAEGRGSLHVGARYLCVLLKKDRLRGSDWIRESTDRVLTLRCKETVTRELETVCLVHA